MENAGEPLREFIKGLRWEKRVPLEKGREYGSATKFVALFVTALLNPPVSFGFAYFIYCHFDRNALAHLLVSAIVVFATCVNCVPVVRLSIRNAGTVWAAAILGSSFGMLLFGYGVIYTWNNYAHPTVDELMKSADGPFRCFMFLIGIVYIAVCLTLAAAIRASMPFSEKTNRWLQPYTCGKRFTPSGDVEAGRLTYDDVLRFEPTKKICGAYRFALCLDRVADGDMILWLRCWQGLKPLRMGLKSILAQEMPLTPQQVETLARKFGPFKRSSHARMWFS